MPKVDKNSHPKPPKQPNGGILEKIAKVATQNRKIAKCSYFGDYDHPKPPKQPNGGIFEL